MSPGRSFSHREPAQTGLNMSFLFSGPSWGLPLLDPDLMRQRTLSVTVLYSKLKSKHALICSQIGLKKKKTFSIDVFHFLVLPLMIKVSAQVVLLIILRCKFSIAK